MSAVASVLRVTFALTLLCGVPHVARAHPLHTTLTEITENRSAGTVRATIRVFADDFGTAVRKATGTTATPGSGGAWDVAALAYVTRAFVLADASGRQLAASSCGTRATGGLLWICIEVAAPAGIVPLRVRDAMLCELFADQVNVVQGTVSGARRSVLFTRGDAAKPLR